MSRTDNVSELEPIVLTCRLVQQPFDVPAYRAGDLCYCPYCGEPHRVPSDGLRQLVGSVAYASISARRRTSGQSRFTYTAAGVCGLITGLFVGLGLGELTHDRRASAIMLEKLLEKATEEKRQAMEDKTAAEERLAAAGAERRQIERERNELRRRLSDIQLGLDETVLRLERLRQ